MQNPHLNPLPQGEEEEQRKLMKKKITILALGAMLFALCPPADAQQAGKIPRIGSNNLQSLHQFDIPIGRR